MLFYFVGIVFKDGVIEYDLYYNIDDFFGFYYLIVIFDVDSYDG